MDATFRTSPHKYYQLFNILIDVDLDKLIFPVLHVIMSHKSYYSYLILFKNLNILFENFEINFTFD